MILITLVLSTVNSWTESVANGGKIIFFRSEVEHTVNGFQYNLEVQIQNTLLFFFATTTNRMTVLVFFIKDDNCIKKYIFILKFTLDLSYLIYPPFLFNHIIQTQDLSLNQILQKKYLGTFLKRHQKLLILNFNFFIICIIILKFFSCQFQIQYHFNIQFFFSYLEKHQQKKSQFIKEKILMR
ncbi:unnamed protein product [Paramecium sonneborni]|uniref:Transmembrane protein n=1 Tax=Paramecium sonneborni TaxID=65129 RepID=A0A8S1KGJ3_9CILI|nr:unnamed protein product [Paramecium sonneborni]